VRAECVRAIEELALSDPKVVVVASDPASDFMRELAAEHPERLMIEGVCEQAMAGMSAGLASEGFYPFMFMLAVFGTRRCYEQILLDFGLHRLAGCVVGSGGGFTYAPLGPTHIAVDDCMLVSAIPGSAVLAPAEPAEAVQLAQSARKHKGLSFMRLSGTTASLKNPRGDIVLGKSRFIGQPGPVLFISTGAATLEVESALDMLRSDGIQAGALHLHTLKPLDAEAVRRAVREAKVVICAEEHRQVGGLASAVLLELMTKEPAIVPNRLVSVAVDDTYPEGNGSYEEMMEHYGLSSASLAERARSLLAQAA
jgi:transketolase